MDAPGSTRRVLIVEDTATVRMHFKLVLEREGFEVMTAADGRSGVRAAREFRPHVVLLDYFLPDVTGETVVESIRSFDTDMQILLVTGGTSAHPARGMMQRLDIQGYHDKSDGIGKLLVWIEAALKAHDRNATIRRQTEGLRRVVAGAAAVHRMQPMESVLADAYQTTAALLLERAPVPADAPHAQPGAVVQFSSCGRATVVLGVGPLSGATTVDALPPEARRLTMRIANAEALQSSGDWFGVPIAGRDGTRFGILVHSGQPVDPVVTEYVALFASSVAVAVENVTLFSMATIDPVTGLMTRAHVMQRLVEWLKIVVRTSQPLSLIFIDMDKLKPVNDTHGHVVGDAILAALGERVSSSIRDVDNAGRLGGDEFMIVLPTTPPRMAARVAARVCARILSTPVAVNEQLSLDLSASIGVGGFDMLPLRSWMRGSQPDAVWHQLAVELVEVVDAACYQAKSAGGGRIARAGHHGDLGLELLGRARALVESTGASKNNGEHAVTSDDSPPRLVEAPSDPSTNSRRPASRAPLPGASVQRTSADVPDRCDPRTTTPSPAEATALGVHGDERAPDLRVRDAGSVSEPASDLDATSPVRDVA